MARKERKDKYLGIRLTDEEHEALRKASEEYGWSMSHVMRRLISLFVRRHKELTSGETATFFLEEGEEPPDS